MEILFKKNPIFLPWQWNAFTLFAFTFYTAPSMGTWERQTNENETFWSWTYELTSNTQLFALTYVRCTLCMRTKHVNSLSETTFFPFEKGYQNERAKQSDTMFGIEVSTEMLFLSQTECLLRKINTKVIKLEWIGKKIWNSKKFILFLQFWIHCFCFLFHSISQFTT